MKGQRRKTRNQPAASIAKRRSPIKGVVTSRKCSSCGHHEVGITTETRKFLALKPGMKIVVLRGGKER